MPQNRIPFEIIPLQTARKENSWKTEEALDRAAVTVETERIKGPILDVYDDDDDDDIIINTATVKTTRKENNWKT